MTAKELAKLHALVDAAPWSEASFEGQLAQSGTILVDFQNAFALGRMMADEAELLLIATDPAYQRQGLAKRLLGAFEQKAKGSGCTRAFLEVATGNTPANTLYTAAGWKIDGLRKDYYRRADGSRENARLMSKSL